VAVFRTRIRDVQRAIELAVLVAAIENVQTLRGLVIALLHLLSHRRAAQGYLVLLQNLAMIEQFECALALQNQDFVSMRIFGKGVARRAGHRRCKQDKEARKTDKRGCPSLRESRRVGNTDPNATTTRNLWLLRSTRSVRLEQAHKYPSTQVPKYPS